MTSSERQSHKYAIVLLFAAGMATGPISAHSEEASKASVTARVAGAYVFGRYQGDFVSPPSADGNPRRAIIVEWKDRPWRFVFWHEASYCPFFELSDGSGASFQFFEGNDGWAELFNQYGRMETNSFVEVLDDGPPRVHVRWTYFAVNQVSGERAYQAKEDFYCLANGLVLRRQAYESLIPNRREGYAREPIELIGMCPAGKTWKDVLAKGKHNGERHALAALDPFTPNRYDVYWSPSAGTIWESTPRRAGCAWRDIDAADGVVLVLPMRAGSPFCAFGNASGFDPKRTRIKEHSFTETGGIGWVSSSWDHWPVGWLNSQGHVVDAESLAKYPNHFSPAGMDLFAIPNEEVDRGEYWSLIGVGGNNIEDVRSIAREWLELASGGVHDATRVEKLKIP